MTQTDPRGRERALASEMDEVVTRADELETQAARQLRLAAEARAVAGDDDHEAEMIDGETGRPILADGGNTHTSRINEQLAMADKIAESDPDPMTLENTDDDSTDIQVGDVCLDLAQGRPVHVINDTELTAAEWSEANNYELTENYGNERLGATDEDRVFDVVYCGSIKSKPSKDYAFPESRLARIETEAADGGRAVADRIRVDVLERLFARAAEDDGAAMDVLEAYAADVGVDPDVIDEARELSEVEQVIGGGE